ncbi:unnamed protein product [Calypogeia fissa]
MQSKVKTELKGKGKILSEKENCPPTPQMVDQIRSEVTPEKESNVEEVSSLEEQGMDNLFILNVSSVDADCREYFQLRRAREMPKFKKQLEEEAQDSTRAGRRPLPIPTVTADENESREENVQNESVDNANV